MAYYTPLLGTIPLTLEEIAFIETLAAEADFDTTKIPLISTGTTKPSTTPTAVGELYVNTVDKVAYFATGTSAVTDWRQINITVSASAPTDPAINDLWVDIT